MTSIHALKASLLIEGNPERAAHAKKYFKTGKGEYAEGDIFVGLTNPQVQAWAKKHYRSINLDTIQEFLKDEIHEVRFAALLVMIEQFKKGDELIKSELINCYLNNVTTINNWDLVDCSVYKLLGEWLLDKDRSVLYELAQTSHLWSQRIGIITTLAFIRQKQYSDTLRLAEILMNHPHDLIHKACGWMLREVGKRDELVLEEFLDEHLSKMPRTMLRYAIERFPEVKRLSYLKKS